MWCARDAEYLCFVSSSWYHLASPPSSVTIQFEQSHNIDSYFHAWIVVFRRVAFISSTSHSKQQQRTAELRDMLRSFDVYCGWESIQYYFPVCTDGHISDSDNSDVVVVLNSERMRVHLWRSLTWTLIHIPIACTISDFNRLRFRKDQWIDSPANRNGELSFANQNFSVWSIDFVNFEFSTWALTHSVLTHINHAFCHEMIEWRKNYLIQHSISDKCHEPRERKRFETKIRGILSFGFRLRIPLIHRNSNSTTENPRNQFCVSCVTTWESSVSSLSLFCLLFHFSSSIRLRAERPFECFFFSLLSIVVVIRIFSAWAQLSAVMHMIRWWRVTDIFCIRMHMKRKVMIVETFQTMFDGRIHKIR